jgi:large-conductance mechanosensitive channel
MAESHRPRASGRPADKKPQSPFAEFLNPNSMITPGAAGAFTMVITNTLCQQFGQLPLNYTGLAVSFVFGAVVFGYGASLVSRMVYFVINSLIIFVVANGSNAIGVRLDSGAATKTASLQTGMADKSGSFGLASTDADKAAEKSKQPSPPPPPPDKPKFFRQW